MDFRTRSPLEFNFPPAHHENRSHAQWSIEPESGFIVAPQISSPNRISLIFLHPRLLRTWRTIEEIFPAKMPLLQRYFPSWDGVQVNTLSSVLLPVSLVSLVHDVIIRHSISASEYKNPRPSKLGRPLCPLLLHILSTAYSPHTNYPHNKFQQTLAQCPLSQ